MYYSRLMTAARPTAGEHVAPGAAPCRLHREVRRFIGLWSVPLLGRPGVPASILIAIVSLCLVPAYIGLSGIQVYSHDAFGALDGAWRGLHGQKPHADRSE